MADSNNTASAQAAGYVLQLERALNHLAHAGPDTAVAVEHLDDVVVLKDGKAVLQEQDKSTATIETKLLADRSKAIWRTLEIWLLQRQNREVPTCERYLFFVNQRVDTPIATLLKGKATGQASTSDIVAALRQAGTPKTRKTKSKIQTLIDGVLERSDDEIMALIDRVEIVEASGWETDRASMANGLGLSPRADIDDIL